MQNCAKYPNIQNIFSLQNLSGSYITFSWHHFARKGSYFNVGQLKPRAKIKWLFIWQMFGACVWWALCWSNENKRFQLRKWLSQYCSDKVLFQHCLTSNRKDVLASFLSDKAEFYSREHYFLSLSASVYLFFFRFLDPF